MAKLQKEDKRIIYLQNFLFLFFDKYIDDPETVGKKIANTIKTVLLQLYPDRKEFEEHSEKIREEWLCLFRKGFNKGIR